MPLDEAFGCAAAQLLGGLLGVLAAHAMFELDIFQISTKLRPGPAQWLSEAVAIFGLVTTILLTLRAKPEAAAASVGLYITAAYWFTASTSFANPAVTVARALSNTFAGIRPSDVLPFIIAQMFGAVLAFHVCDRLLSGASKRWSDNPYEGPAAASAGGPTVPRWRPQRSTLLQLSCGRKFLGWLVESRSDCSST